MIFFPQRGGQILSRGLLASSVCLISALAAAQSIDVRENGNSEGDRNASDITWVNREALKVTDILLQANGALGRTGTAGKIDSGNGGHVSVSNDATIELFDSGVFTIEANGANYELGPSTFNLSARPGAAGSIEFINNGLIKAQKPEGDLHQPGGLVRLSASAGDQGEDRNRNADEYYPGKPGGSINVTLSGKIEVPVDQGGLDALYAISKGGRGFETNSDRLSETGSGGVITLNMTGASIQTGSTAVDLLSLGGGETRSSGNPDYRPGGDGGPVQVNLVDSSVVTSLKDAYGIRMRSWGGENFVADHATNVVFFSPRTGEWFAKPRSGSVGGSGGGINISLNPLSSIETHGDNAHAVYAESSGGLGGFGDDHWSLIVASSGGGGAAGSGGDLTVTQQGHIETHGKGSHGVLLGSKGGGRFQDLLYDNSTSLNRESAGDSKGALTIVNLGGKGAAGGNGGRIDVIQQGFIETNGQDSVGLYAASVGGGGGAGGAVFNITAGGVAVVGPLSLTLGGDGGSGGSGGVINFNRDDSIAVPEGPGARGVTTHGVASPAVALYSIGGGGGLGSASNNLSLALPAYVSVSVAVNVGGMGGAGGDGGQVSATNEHLLNTHGSFSSGFSATSIGGGGGKGGLAENTMLNLLDSVGLGMGDVDFGSISANVGVGGTGGGGGNGGAVTFDNRGTIQTRGDESPGARLTSIGGGGAVGGNSAVMNVFLNAPKLGSFSPTGKVRTNIAVGGSGGKGGSGGNIESQNFGRIETGIGGLGDRSPAIKALSIGGGGGDGGMAATYSVDAWNVFVSGISKAWDDAMKAGSQTESGFSTQVNINVTVGGSGGSGGSGGFIDLTNESGGELVTHGANAAGISAMSIGGGGGVGMLPVGTQNVSGHKANIIIGGSGGGDKGDPLGNGGRVVVANKGLISTFGNGSPGVFAQSVGGGGGDAGDSKIDHQDFNAIENTRIVATEIQAWKDLIVNAKSAKKTYDFSPPEVKKKLDPSSKSPISEFSLALSLGGDGGAGGDGGSVEISSTGRIKTEGPLSAAIWGQSIGGGGGNGGVGTVGGGAIKLGVKEIAGITNEQPGAGAAGAFWQLFSKPSLNMAFGGSGGAAGDGGPVVANLSNSITTVGRSSAGIFLQSVGGGGGTGGGAIDTTSGFGRLSIRKAGDGGSGGHGGRLEVNSVNTPAPLRIHTQGDLSAAIKLLTVGGGGGQAQVLSSIGRFDGLEAYAPPEFADEDKFALTVETMALKENTAIVGTRIDTKDTWYDKLSGFRDTVSKGLAGDVWGAAQNAWKTEQKFTDSKDKTELPATILSLDFEFDSAGSAGGDGGGVNVNLGNDTLQTDANYSPGLEAYSIGGGGLIATTVGRDKAGALKKPSLTDIGADLIKRVLSVEQGKYGDGGKGGDITVSMDTTSIETQGQRSHGLLLKSIGGGGGYYGEADILVYAPPEGSDEAPKGDGGKIKVDASGRNQIRTAGDYAHGIFAVSAGGGFGSVALDGETVVLDNAAKQGAAGQISLKYSGSILAAGEQSLGMLVVSAGASGGNALIDINLSAATVAAIGHNQAVGLIGQATRYQILLDEESTLSAVDGYAIAAMTKGKFGDGLSRESLWARPEMPTDAKANEVTVANRSTLTGDVLLSGPSRLIFKESSTWNPGTYSVIGGVDSLQRGWDQPVKFLREVDGEMQATNLDVKLDQLGQVAMLSGSMLNPGGAAKFMTSAIHIGANEEIPGQLWFSGGSTLEIDVGHDDSGNLKHDQLQVNLGSSQSGSIVSGFGDSGAYNVKIRLLGLRGVTGKEMVIAQTSSRIMPGKLVQPLAVTGHNYEIRSAEGGGEQMVYQVDSVRFDREQMSGFARSIARQMDEALAQGNYKKESSMVAALGYYAGDESVYEEQLAELAENGTVLDVTARRIEALALQNNLHSCLVFVGDGLGLVEQNCTYARVTGSDVSLSGASGSDSDQTVTGSQIAIGGQRQIGEGLFAGLMFGVGQANADSNDSEYRSTSESLTLGAVIKKRFDEQYEVAVSGTYSYGWADTSRYLLSDMAAPANLTGSNHNSEAGLRLRLAYYGTAPAAYIKPYVDFDARYYYSSAFTESGNSPFAINYPSMSFWTYTATPQLEVGTRINTDSGVWRAYASGGVALSNDNKQNMLADFVSASGGSQVELQWEATPTMGIVKVGAEYVGDDDAFVSFAYEGMFGSGVRQQSLTARVGLRF